ncbi:hypothetical protein EOE18_12035 [Novosphingobium umbonatum]|uniref:Uncharacterized protein n=1 Tax=Novosphingobium umbonatum TaxID=1908524 RepID=A0A3S2UQC1_9SPHN|nr:hypothetical protein EOE18_12035 [Novosphingobium umbonatum]
MPILGHSEKNQTYSVHHLNRIYTAVEALRGVHLPNEKLLDDILSAADALELLASTRHAGCSAAEAAVSAWTNGLINQHYDASYDVLSGNGAQLEVKFSKLNQPNKNSRNMRWNWTNILVNSSDFKNPTNI